MFSLSLTSFTCRVVLWEKELKTAKAKHALSRERNTKLALKLADMHMEDTAHQIKQHSDHTEHVKAPPSPFPMKR